MTSVCSGGCPRRDGNERCSPAKARRPRLRVTCPSGCDCGPVHDQPESRGIGDVLVAGDDEVLRTRGRERDEQTRFLSAHGQAVGNILGKRGVRAGLDLDPLVADESGDRAVENVDRLVLTRVGVDRRVVAGAHAPFNDGPVATRLLAGKLELGGRAMAAGNGAARLRTGQNGVAQGHVTSPFDGEVAQADDEPFTAVAAANAGRGQPAIYAWRAWAPAGAKGAHAPPATLTIAPSIVATAGPKIATSGASRRRRVIRPVRAPRDRAGRRT